MLSILRKGDIIQQEIMVRTRIAPSPTGFPHIGTIYQALFDYSFAKKNNGQFIIRIEDTDQKRFVSGSEEKIYEALDWFGLSEDESQRKGGTYFPYRESERLPLYKKYAQELVSGGNAYYCFCSRERLEENRKKMQAQRKVPMYDKHCRTLTKEEIKKRLEAKASSVIRLKVPENQKITVRDEIRGEITFDSNTIDDQIILKSDGFPTYHLAATVDDYLMKITHVVRGEEWLSSFPKHVLIYDYFGWEKPLFYHTPDLRNPDKSKLSKRHGHTNVEWYREQGFLPETILNFLALLGWSHPKGKDIFSLDEFIKLFDLKDLKPVGPIFDIQKLEWMNGEYIRQMQNSKLKDQIYLYYKKQFSNTIIGQTIPIVKERIKKLSDYLPLCEFFFTKPEKYELNLSNYRQLIQKMHNELLKLDKWQASNIGEGMQNLAKKEGIKNSEFFMVLRIAVSGKKITPPLNESMEILGKEECLKRIQSVTSTDRSR